MRTTYISNDASTKKATETTRGGHVRASADQELEAELDDKHAQIKAIEVRCPHDTCDDTSQRFYDELLCAFTHLCCTFFPRLCITCPFTAFV